MTPARYVAPCLARIAGHIARETRQRDAALAAGNRRKAAEHQDRINKWEIERAVLTEKWAPQMPAGMPIQTEMML